MKICIFFILLLSMNISFGQNLNDLQLACHYTFINSGSDETGNYGDAEIVNAPFQGQDGIYSFGGYLFDVINEDSSLIKTPNISVLNDSTFAVQVEFKIDSLTAGKPIVIIGEGWRWLGLSHIYDSTLQALWNGIYYDTESGQIKKDTWYTASIVHKNDTTSYFLDGQIIFKKGGELDHPEDDLEISNSHYGWGVSYRGYWKNLKVYSASKNTSLSDFANTNQIKIYPNPTPNFIHIQHTEIAKKYMLINQFGQIVDRGFIENEILYIGNQKNGLYQLSLYDEHDLIIQSSKILKIAR